VTLFIILCAVMVLAAVAVVAYPLLKPQRSAIKGQPESPPALAPAVVIGLLLVLGAAAMYGHASNFPWKDPSLAQQAPAGHGDMSSASIEEITRQLEAKLAANPGDAEGWRMLARTYLVSQRPKDAITAYQKAIALVGDKDPSLNLDLAEAMILTDDATVQGQARALVDAALAADASNQKALWYSGVMAYKANDMETAKARWSKLLEQNPPPEIRQVIEQQLQALGVAVPAGSVASAAAPAAGPAGGGEAESAPQGRTIRVSVSVDPAVKDRVKPGTVVFVAAREPGIPGPPLAATRLTTDSLPTTVTLSDADAMMAGRNLSSVADVEVVAHVAFAGTPMVASGDLVGSAIQKKGGSTDLAVAIARVQP